MQIFILTVLENYAQFPCAKSSEIAHNLGVSPQMVKWSRKELLRLNLLVRNKAEWSTWYVTFAGRLALSKFDKEKAHESHEKIRSAVELICKTLDSTPEDLENFTPMDKGMTNDSYIFYCRGKKYIYRLAGQGSDVLVDRHREYANYLALDGKNISDKVIYHNAFTGTKISEFIEDSSNLNEKDPEQLEQALIAIRHLHNCGIKTEHSFDLKERINYYEVTCLSREVVLFASYPKHKANMMILLDKIKTLNVPTCFCHIDFIPDNCMLKDGKVILIDWEYSGMQDPLIDLAMFCISTSFDKVKCDKLLEQYLQRKPTTQEFFRLYTYIAAGGLTWSLWSEYKASQGEIFEGYTDQVYNLCKKYSAKALLLIDKL